MGLNDKVQTPGALSYRAEIDGLRAIAVLAVVLFHARLPIFTEGHLLSGGYAGVDVFFVISGFLISRLIAQEWERTRRFSILGFYERRIRRLIPALVLMVGATIAAGWLWLPPAELMRLSRAAFAALAFFSNLYFAKETGYFQPRAETEPLLHTWSLGVEEQFYILAPFIIVGLMLLPLKWRRVALGLLVVASLTFAIVTGIRGIDGGFFWPHPRAYELLIGVALGMRLVPLPTGERARRKLALAGLALVATALLILPPGVGYPSFWALWPCLGTAMVLAATEEGAIPGRAGAMLRAGVMRFFGRISYSLYLWHWPVLVYGEMQGWAEGVPARLGLIALAVAVSWLSFRFVEAPFRHGVAKSRLVQIFAPTALVVAAGFGFMRLNDLNFGYANRFGPVFAQATQAMNEPTRPKLNCKDGRHCAFGDASLPLRYLIWGDSHAEMLGAEFGHLAREKGARGIILTAGGCPPALEQGTGLKLARKKCSDTALEALRIVEQNPGITVIIAARWGFYAEATRFGADEMGFRVRALVLGGAEANRDAFGKLILATVKTLQDKGAKVRLIGSVPEFREDVLRIAARVLMRGEKPAIAMPRAVFEERQRAVRAGFDEARKAGAGVFEVSDGLCDAAQCHATRAGVPLYADSNHLLPAGVALVAARLAAAME